MTTLLNETIDAGDVIEITRNGDVISTLRGSGVGVIACNTAVGCSLVTLKIQ